MKIGVISDTHGSLASWNRSWPFLKDMDLIVHCGDLLYHGPRNPLPEDYNPQELAKTLNAVEIPVLIAGGNCDANVDQIMLDYPIESPYVQIFTDMWRIFVHHGHAFMDRTLPSKVKTPNYNLVISGHTHIPGIERNDGLILLNPGSPSLPKNQPRTATIAVIEGQTISIINIDNGDIVEEVSL